MQRTDNSKPVSWLVYNHDDEERADRSGARNRGGASDPLGSPTRAAASSSSSPPSFTSSSAPEEVRQAENEARRRLQEQDEQRSGRRDYKSSSSSSSLPLSTWIILLILTSLISSFLTTIYLRNNAASGNPLFASYSTTYNQFGSGSVAVAEREKELAVTAIEKFVSNTTQISEVCQRRNATLFSQAETARSLALSKHLSSPFYCRADSWILGNWSTDGHTYYPHTLYRPDDIVTKLDQKKDQYHIFTPEEARTCLRDRSIYFMGPSYMRDVYTTLVDLLHNYHRVGYHQMNPPEHNVTLMGEGLDNVRMIHLNGFFQHYKKNLIPAIAKFANKTLIADVLIWDINKATVEAMNDDEEMSEEVYFMNLRRFLEICKQHNVRLFWMTQMSTDHGVKTTVPIQYRALQSDSRYLPLLLRTIRMLNEYDVPWFDVFHLTGSCVTDPSETDPGQPCNASAHSNWYVSAMKMQIVLNFLCRKECVHPKDKKEMEMKIKQAAATATQTAAK